MSTRDPASHPRRAFSNASNPRWRQLAMQMSSAQLPKPMFPLQWSDHQSEQGGVRSEHFQFQGGWGEGNWGAMRYNCTPISQMGVRGVCVGLQLGLSATPKCGVGNCPVEDKFPGLGASVLSLQYAVETISHADVQSTIATTHCQNLSFHCIAQKSNRSKGVEDQTTFRFGRAHKH